MSTANDVLTRAARKIFPNSSQQTLTTTTQPNTTEMLQWLNDGIRILTQVFAEHGSEYGRSISKISTRESFPISNITQANPGVVTTSEANGFSASDTPLFTGIEGMVELNAYSGAIAIVDTTSFSLTGKDTSGYTVYTGNGLANPKPYYADLSSTLWIPAPRGVCSIGNRKWEIYLCDQAEANRYAPAAYGAPEKFYLDASSNLYLLPGGCDDVYLLEIPYWAHPTELTTTSSTMPFGGIFDRYLADGLVRIALNRDEYNLNYEDAWQNYLLAKISFMLRKRGAGLVDFFA